MILNRILDETTYKLTAACAGCGAAVTKYKKQLIPDTYAFCSLKCRNKNYKKVHPDWHPPNYQGDIELTCNGCSDMYTVSRDRNNNRKYCSKSCAAKNIKRRKHSPKTKAKLSKRAAEQCRRYSGNVIYRGRHGIIGMRSGWEVKYAEYLDSNDINWIYEPEGYELSSGYVYIPDFRLDNGDIIEIKGYWREDAKIKWDMFCEEYPHINKHIFMGDDLKKMNII